MAQQAPENMSQMHVEHPLLPLSDSRFDVVPPPLLPAGGRDAHVPESGEAANAALSQQWDARRSFSGQSMFCEMLEEPVPTMEQLEVSFDSPLDFSTLLLGLVRILTSQPVSGFRLSEGPLRQSQTVFQ